jgi:hypothetical protein
VRRLEQPKQNKVGLDRPRVATGRQRIPVLLSEREDVQPPRAICSVARVASARCRGTAPVRAATRVQLASAVPGAPLVYATNPAPSR